MRAFRSDRPFLVANAVFFLFVAGIMLAPMIHEIAISFSGYKYVSQNAILFWPRGSNLGGYKYVVGQARIWRSLAVSVYITAVGTFLTLVLVSTIAYALSRPYMPARKLIMRGIIITFIFAVPLIPFYLVVRTLGMNNTLWALIVPQAVSAFNVIIMKTFFQGISQELFDAATIDGCSEFGTYFRITLPLSTAVIATIGLFAAVQQWNAYFYAIVFIQSPDLRPLQVLLRSLVIEGGIADTTQYSDMALTNNPPDELRAATIVFGTLPILMVYPFIQRYFVKGAMLGSLKA